MPDRLRSIPNVLTSLRLLLAPWAVAAVIRGEHRLAVAIFAGAAFTDLLDGALARRFGWVSTTGAYLDPIADKLLLSGVYLAFAAAGILPWWFVGIIIGRDLLILASSVFALLFTRIRKFPPSVWGKLSTFLQVVTAVAWLVRNVLVNPAVNILAGWLIWPTAAATVWSGLHYAWRGFRLIRTH